jgi:hypothetical protein
VRLECDRRAQEVGRQYDLLACRMNLIRLLGSSFHPIKLRGEAVKHWQEADRQGAGVLARSPAVSGRASALDRRHADQNSITSPSLAI